MESYFVPFRQQVLGIDHHITTPYNNNQRIIYADWTASGRCYATIEDRFRNEIMPLVANTHTETNTTGMAMTHAYHTAKEIIKKHVNANKNDVLISCGSGMTGVINKLQRILGLKLHERFRPYYEMEESEVPIVFVTHMEHHSNQTSWLETIADVVIIPPNEEGLVCIKKFRKQLELYKDRPLKIAAVTSCSNVTGIMTPYHEIAEAIHEVGGFCFVDFAASAPYININMHPKNKQQQLDAIYFSPHKFLGGPGSSGILIFNKKLYHNNVPDHPGGGTVAWTNPWGEHKYFDDIEAREDGGTPAFLQTMKVAMCTLLKDEMGVKNILRREHEQMEMLWAGLTNIPNLHILAEEHKERLGIISFYIDGLHYNAAVKMLNDRFGIQTRGGCSCAGTYGHYLLNVAPETSESITSRISQGDCSTKPGWIRLSIHPTMTNDEILELIHGIQQLALHHKEWIKDYIVHFFDGTIKHKNEVPDQEMADMMDECLTRSFSDNVFSKI